MVVDACHCNNQVALCSAFALDKLVVAEIHLGRVVAHIWALSLLVYRTI